jgi:hypothetical protein
LDPAVVLKITALVLEHAQMVWIHTLAIARLDTTVQIAAMTSMIATMLTAGTVNVLTLLLPLVAFVQQVGMVQTARITSMNVSG